MYLTSFWAQGFRSLASVRLDELSAFNIFYGGNGTGKSNVLVAIGHMFELMAVAAEASFAVELVTTVPKCLVAGARVEKDLRRAVSRAADRLMDALRDDSNDTARFLDVFAQQLVDRMVVRPP